MRLRWIITIYLLYALVESSLAIMQPTFNELLTRSG